MDILNIILHALYYWPALAVNFVPPSFTLINTKPIAFSREIGNDRYHAEEDRIASHRKKFYTKNSKNDRCPSPIPLSFYFNHGALHVRIFSNMSQFHTFHFWDIWDICDAYPPRFPRYFLHPEHLSKFNWIPIAHRSFLGNLGNCCRVARHNLRYRHGSCDPHVTSRTFQRDQPRRTLYPTKQSRRESCQNQFWSLKI